MMKKHFNLHKYTGFIFQMQLNIQQIKTTITSNSDEMVCHSIKNLMNFNL